MLSYSLLSVGIKCEKSRHQRKDAKRAEKMRKEPFYGRKNRLCYIELDFERTGVIKNKCQGVTNIFMTFFVRNTFESEENAVEKMRKEPTFM